MQNTENTGFVMNRLYLGIPYEVIISCVAGGQAHWSSFSTPDKKCLNDAKSVTVTYAFVSETWRLILACINKKAWHTTYSWNIKWQKCPGISGLWVLNEIIQKKYPENMKKIVGAV